MFRRFGFITSGLDRNKEGEGRMRKFFVQLFGVVATLALVMVLLVASLMAPKPLTREVKAVNGLPEPFGYAVISETDPQQNGWEFPFSLNSTTQKPCVGAFIDGQLQTNCETDYLGDFSRWKIFENTWEGPEISFFYENSSASVPVVARRLAPGSTWIDTSGLVRIETSFYPVGVVELPDSILTVYGWQWEPVKLDPNVTFYGLDPVTNTWVSEYVTPIDYSDEYTIIKLVLETEPTPTAVPPTTTVVPTNTPYPTPTTTPTNNPLPTATALPQPTNTTVPSLTPWVEFLPCEYIKPSEFPVNLFPSTGIAACSQTQVYANGVPMVAEGDPNTPYNQELTGTYGNFTVTVPSSVEVNVEVVHRGPLELYSDGFLTLTAPDWRGVSVLEYLSVNTPMDRYYVVWGEGYLTKEDPNYELQSFCGGMWISGKCWAKYNILRLHLKTNSLPTPTVPTATPVQPTQTLVPGVTPTATLVVPTAVPTATAVPPTAMPSPTALPSLENVDESNFPFPVMVYGLHDFNVGVAANEYVTINGVTGVAEYDSNTPYNQIVRVESYQLEVVSSKGIFYVDVYPGLPYSDDFGGFTGPSEVIVTRYRSLEPTGTHFYVLFGGGYGSNFEWSTFDLTVWYGRAWVVPSAETWTNFTAIRVVDKSLPLQPTPTPIQPLPTPDPSQTERIYLPLVFSF